MVRTDSSRRNGKKTTRLVWVNQKNGKQIIQKISGMDTIRTEEEWENEKELAKSHKRSKDINYL